MIAQKLHTIFPYFWQSLRNSYTQIFFSKHPVLGALLILVSLFDLNAGFSGLIAVISANGVAYLSGMNRQRITDGLYGFNALLTGLGLGAYYQLSWPFLVVLLFSSLLALLVTGMMEGWLSKYGLPYLSLPFLAAVWIILLASRQYTQLEYSQKGIYVLNEMHHLGGLMLVRLYEWFGELAWPDPVKVYFRSLGAIFFQYHLFAGIVISFGLIYWSRQAFVLSVIGFALAWLFYGFIGANLAELGYTYIGFNFILTAIAIGGFFVVPSASSYLWMMLSVPLLAFITASGTSVFAGLQLGIYSLSFNITVILVLYLFRLRERFHYKPTIVLIQQYSPEKNLYSHLINKDRFSAIDKLPIQLPFMGKWVVTQGIDGDYTHQDVWRYAWDFEMTAEDGKTFKNEGLQLTDYFCFGKPVIAPADGYIMLSEDGVEDNPVGDMNLKNNWGNTIVLSHGGGLFSQLSHLKKDSSRVKAGQYVKKGELLALCGNSGRSPYPHLHFQFQLSGEIGAATYSYPINSYLVHGNKLRFQASAQPQKGEIVSNFQPIELLENALHFIPGQALNFLVKEAGQEREIRWNTETDIYNNTYFECQQTKAKAWFIRQAGSFYFTHFEGNRNSMLYHFYLSCYELPLGFIAGLEVSSPITLSIFPNKILLTLQDFIAPFFRFLSATYQLRHHRIADSLSEPSVVFTAETRFCVFGKNLQNRSFEILFTSGQIQTIKIRYDQKDIELLRQ